MNNFYFDSHQDIQHFKYLNYKIASFTENFTQMKFDFFKSKLRKKNLKTIKEMVKGNRKIR